MTGAGPRRVAILAGSALGCAVLSGLAALEVQRRDLPPTDGAYGMSLFETLSDPLVLMIWLPLVLGAAAVGFVHAVFALQGVRLAPAIGLTSVLTIVAAAVTARAFMPLAPFIALVAGIIGLDVSRLMFSGEGGEGGPRAPGPSAARGRAT